MTQCTTDSEFGDLLRSSRLRSAVNCCEGQQNGNCASLGAFRSARSFTSRCTLRSCFLPERSPSLNPFNYSCPWTFHKCGNLVDTYPIPPSS
ncbi:hypothetical protein CEXT_206551 [Caerostris extrusa]|uniref:Uncharacterized protein n=1 Tax=Caerostris extrusa TaxID=172846 RepID=A0AAV4NGG7_CAEEX|nr:hypothetical protein CEXT_206551 [Caerostris extrusa]